MVASHLLSKDIIPLQTSDTGDDALRTMGEFYVKHLPIVNNQELLGLLSEEEVLDNDPSEPIGSYPLRFTKLSVKDTDHIYDVLKLVNDFQLTTVPVIDDKGNYQGLIALEDLVKFFAGIGSFAEPGSILVLEMARQDYSLAMIARIAESEDALILSSFISATTDERKIDVTLKLNRKDIQRVKASFERHKFEIKASFQEEEYFDSLRDRFDSFMAYINV